jgi:formylmethanofuran dehydrogenase subunit E
MSSTQETAEEVKTSFAAANAQLDETWLIEYLSDTRIPCANCGEQIDVDDSHRWVNRLVCASCITEYEGLDPADEENYDAVYEEEIEV